MRSKSSSEGDSLPKANFARTSAALADHLVAGGRLAEVRDEVDADAAFVAARGVLVVAATSSTVRWPTTSSPDGL
jgi:hypothetical protein